MMMARQNSTTSSMMLAIAAGDAIALWDCSSDELDSAFQPHGIDSDVADIAWNHNGQVLASITTNAQKENELLACSYDSVVLTSVLSQKPLESFRQAWNDKLLMKSRSDGSYGCSYTSIAFGVKSRYLCLGDTSGDVSLLDLKKSCVVVRQYPSSDGLACRQASLDPTESFVIVLSRETLSIFQLREGALLHRFSVYDDTSGSLSFTNFHVSPFRQLPSMIAVGTDQGCIQVLDIANSFQKTTATPADEPWQPRFTLTNAPSHTRRGRITSPVVGIAFSAQVKPLLVSISRHGYLSFNDVDLGHHIEQRQVAERVVTSLTYHQDGNILALGTDDGRVAIYDIRNLNDPISTYKMGDAVTCVKFAPAVVVVPVTHNDNNTSSISNSTAGRVDQTDTPTRSNVSPPKIALPPPVQLPSMTALVSSDTEHRDQAEPRESIEEQGSAVDMNEVKTLIQQEIRANLSKVNAKCLNEDAQPSHPCLSPSDKAAVKAMIQDEICIVRDELQQHIQNLHVDMLREFVRLEEKLMESNRNHR